MSPVAREPKNAHRPETAIPSGWKPSGSENWVGYDVVAWVSAWACATAGGATRAVTSPARRIALIVGFIGGPICSGGVAFADRSNPGPRTAERPTCFPQGVLTNFRARHLA